MKDFFCGFKYWKFILALAVGAVLTYGQIRFLKIRLVDALIVTAALTVTWSFTFIHTMLGQGAAISGGSEMNMYSRVKRDMRYNIREDRGYIPETLLAGILELIAEAAMIIMK